MKAKAPIESAPSNSFLRTLGELRKGVTATEASDELANLVREVQRTGSSGEITIKLKIKASGDGESVYIEDSVSTKVPRMPKKATTFFATEDGGLQRDNPKQTEMFTVIEGAKIEGFVVKNYSQFTMEKKIAIAKFVSEEFKEKHATEWKKSNPTKQDVIDGLIQELRTEARWNKAVQHLRDAGQITDSPKDIGALLTEIKCDVLKEEHDYIKDRLWNHFWPHISRGVIAGFPEHYKRTLAESAFPAEKTP